MSHANSSQHLWYAQDYQALAKEALVKVYPTNGCELLFAVPGRRALFGMSALLTSNFTLLLSQLEIAKPDAMSKTGYSVLEFLNWFLVDGSK